MHALSVIEAAFDELHDVRHRLRCVRRIGFELERAFRRLDDDDRPRRLSEDRRR